MSRELRPIVIVLAVLPLCLLLAGCGHAARVSHPGFTPGPTPPPRPGATVIGVGFPPNFVTVSRDGGATWVVRRKGRSALAVPFQMPWDVAFGDRRNAWAVERGDYDREATVLASHDAGWTWSAERTGFKGRLVGVTACDARHVWVLDQIEEYGGMTTLILASSDGGHSWQKERIPESFEVDDVVFSNAQHGWAVMGFPWMPEAGQLPGSTVCSTSDGGRHWQKRYTSETLSLSQLASVDARHCWLIGDTGEGDNPPALILETSDGGAQWTQRSFGPHVHLFGITFVDAEHGWAVGNVVLATADGGRTWVLQKSGCGYDLDGVVFSDREHGWAKIGQEGLLVTENGGRSWTAVMPLGKKADGFVAIACPRS